MSGIKKENPRRIFNMTTPTAAKPTTAKPAAAKPTTAKPAAAKPTTAKPTTAKPAAAKPAAAKPTTAKPADSRQNGSAAPWLVVGILGIGILILLGILLFGNRQSTGNTDNQGSLPTQSVPTVSQPSESTILVLSPLGSYHAVYDSNVEKWTLGIWPEAQVTAGDMTLADLKIKGGTIQFVMPFDGTVNNSAGTVTVNNQQWSLGNPIQDQSGNTLLKKGDIVSVSYGTHNDSAGFQLWFSN